MNAVLELGALPFNIGTRPVPSNSPFPDELPFTAGFDEKLGIIAQVPNPDVAALLDRVYAHGSQLSTPMNDYGLGKATCQDFIDFLLSSRGYSNLSGMRVLEIGCGTGFLLSQLQILGADVLGIEPGMNSSVHAKHAGIHVIHHPFESIPLKDTFDLIVHTNVLEHVGAPLDFLRRQFATLGREGRIVLAVPDCEAPIMHGDLSMFVHEHWSYLTRASLMSLVIGAGGRVVSMRKAGVGGALYAMVEAGDASRLLARASSDAQDEFINLNERASRGEEVMREFISARQKVTVGIYCPGRFLNYWGLAGKPAIRLFDDDAGFHGRYLPPMPFPVETRKQLCAKPVDSLLVMSRTFGEALAADLRGETALHGCEITTVAQLF